MKRKMKSSRWLLWSGLMAGWFAGNPVPAQTPPVLGIQLYAGVMITGQTGSVYVVQFNTDLAQTNGWVSQDFLQLPATNYLWVDTSVPATTHRFYRAQLQIPPTNMVFLPPDTFLLGSPTNEAGRDTNEGPQTVVTLSHGFWMNKFEVTQGDYLAVTGQNPSTFTGDTNRPVESVSWLDASNYCVLRTQQELAAGRIPPGSHYRLPTEAEWEYAARAWTSTRYYYGDDPDITSLTNYAWFSDNSGPSTHSVGQKLPNRWGLYDMEGNVFEWCQDWLGPYPGGQVIDPTGPASVPSGLKVIRGGGWDAGAFECRSAARAGVGVSPFLTDTHLGFRVVLVTGP